MPRYLDSGDSVRENFLGNWLDANIVPGIQGFRLQSGYFGYGALKPYADILRATAEASCPVHIVLGSNFGSLSRDHLQNVLKIVERTPESTLTVAAYANAEFHPKVVHLVRADGSAAVAVGSGNFTERGLGVNVEAFLILDTQQGDAPEAIQAAADAIDRWHKNTEQGIRRIETDEDIEALAAAGIINLSQPARPLPSVTSAAGIHTINPGNRRKVWQPRKISVPSLSTAATTVSSSATPFTSSSSFTRWCKQLQNSDAQQVQRNSNPTGKLRLSQSGFAINHQTAFRQDMFANALWLSESRGGKMYEVAEIDFHAEINGLELGILRLKVDYAPHRAAGQGNVSTVLAWGTAIGQQLRAQSYVGFWAVIERRPDGTFALKIQKDKPLWSPQ